MENKSLHFISMDIPFPPNYGGIIDVFFKLKAFHALGVDLYLHLFGFDKGEIKYLKPYAKEIYFYPIKQKPIYIFNKYPISVVSRKLLIENVKKIKAPLFFESLKTTHFLNENELPDYPKFLRLHNIEHNYFEGLAKSEKNFIKSLLFSIEARKYRKYEEILEKFNQIFTLSINEQKYIEGKFDKGVFVPVFHGNSYDESLEGKGKYAFYHGDLRASDNQNAVLFLIDVFQSIDYPLVIASGSKSDWVMDKIKKVKNIQFVKLKDFEHLKMLFKEAHINVSWSFQESGTKLKVINALFNSRFSVVNDFVIDDENVLKLCEIANTKEELILKINELKDQNFQSSKDSEDIFKRYLNDLVNAKTMLDHIFY